MSTDRRSDRVPTTCEIEFRRHGGHLYPVDLLDLSPEGCRFSPPIKVEPGEGFFLRIPGMDSIHATAAWSKEWMVGALFDKPLHPAVFDHLLKKLSGS